MNVDADWRFGSAAEGCNIVNLREAGVRQHPFDRSPEPLLARLEHRPYQTTVVAAVRRHDRSDEAMIRRCCNPHIIAPPYPPLPPPPAPPPPTGASPPPFSF